MRRIKLNLRESHKKIGFLHLIFLSIGRDDIQGHTPVLLLFDRGNNCYAITSTFFYTKLAYHNICSVEMLVL